jgi:hypothetical protein
MLVLKKDFSVVVKHLLEVGFGLMQILFGVYETNLKGSDNNAG